MFKKLRKATIAAMSSYVEQSQAEDMEREVQKIITEEKMKLEREKYEQFRKAVIADAKKRGDL